ncbi:MAG: VacJ family lipoprotein [Methylococcaceae bacterium]|jgi:phospholipid-binding lipoprotein MlaA|nr:VacJ family lipoprotein [Methylococcaceae bacterium]
MISCCRSFNARRAASLFLMLCLYGCSSTPSKDKDARDPIEGWNRGVQHFNDKLDDYVMKPVATGYQKVTPTAVDLGITNFYSNVDDVGVIGNDLLQFKLLQGGQDLGRFFVNTTVGLAGVVDVASKMNLPKHNEDFDQTLAVWGVPSGPFVVIPFFGPSTPRGIVGLAGDTASNPITWINPMAGYALGSSWHGLDWVILGSGMLRVTDQRADLLSASKIMDEASVDRYEFMRNAYFQQRNYVIHDGNPPLDEELEKQMDQDLEGLDSNGSSVAPPASSTPAAKTISH